ncbi:hypothetical protein G3O08_07305 [Cryomorpha ignava]|uniref:GHKL domain protein n=1 Tax=Cryomorpha ignava TaxID=101383 RepID=A0A7K3WNS1_9FLAO|nr:SiaB family protein kinase [Cryomorpha ignava]NEN23303.1 hypothetical protein [Cryomorpha ignava]
MKVDSSALGIFEKYAEVTYEKVKKSDSEDVIVHFVGDLNVGYTNAISSKLEQLVESKVSDKQARKRFYTAYIEAIQNIQLHGSRDQDSRVSGAVTVSVNGKKICATFLNIIEKRFGEKLINRYELINEKDRTELKTMYLDQMMNGEMSKKGGAGLGIITIVLRSQNPCEVELIPLSEHNEIFKNTICVDYSS